MIVDRLDEGLDLVRREFAVFSENDLPFPVEGKQIAAVIGKLPFSHKKLLVVSEVGCPERAPKNS